ncbi:replication protein A 70 kDa DNA-binding subunit C-like protein [Tanacetum coccineum]|uniref:Replication protein A 70 kDa DNA-binding subunit C-like protein n=1 Tax=Tanacetum coccineum TaxID=301880 RepID=A0ABQ5I2X0_9ASTR
MSTNSVGTKPDNKAACMNESSPTKPQEKMVWDVNAVTGRYLSTDFVVSDSRLIDFDRIEPANNKYLIDVTGYVTDVRRTNYTKTGSKNLDFYLANQRGHSLRVTLWGGLGDVLVFEIKKTLTVAADVHASCVKQKKEGLAIDSSRSRE